MKKYSGVMVRVVELEVKDILTSSISQIVGAEEKNMSLDGYFSDWW